MSDETYRVRRCSTCAINYADFDEFAICARCEGECPRVDIRKHYSVDRAPSVNESRAAVAQFHQEQAVEAERSRAALELELEPIIRAATACLHYDLDRWETEGADWIEETAA